MNTPQIIELHNQRLLTTEQLADLYGTSIDTINQNFKRNKERFIEGKHYYRLEGEKLKAFKNHLTNSQLVGKRASQLILYTKQGASRHSKMLGTDKAWDMFDELEENYFNRNQQLPTTYKEALLQLVEQVEKSEKLEERALIAEQINLELQPKADYCDKILANKGLVTVSTIAKNYGMSAVAFNKLLHELGVQYSQSGTWLLYSKYQDKGYTHTEPFGYLDSDGNEQVRTRTKWTQKGHLFLYELLKRNGTFPMIEQKRTA